MSSYSDFSQQLKTAGIALSAAELHGFLTGLICGGIHDQSWQPLLFQFTNENHAYPTSLLQEVTQIQQHISKKLADIDGFDFELWLPENEDDVFTRADALSEWTNHFLLGLGLAQPKLDKEKGDIGEAIDDLHDICQLGYDESDDKEELSEALEEIIEYVRTLACLLFTHFQPQLPEQKPVLH
ncbi:TPA: YecA family protein [Pasteurella multocida]